MLCGVNFPHLITFKLHQLAIQRKVPLAQLIANAVAELDVTLGALNWAPGVEASLVVVQGGEGEVDRCSTAG